MLRESAKQALYLVQGGQEGGLRRHLLRDPRRGRGKWGEGKEYWKRSGAWNVGQKEG